MRNELLQVTPTDDFELVLGYAVGEHRRFDVKPLLSLKPWPRIAAPNGFELARVAYGTVLWPGHVDIAPETLLLDSHPVQRAERMGRPSEVSGVRTEHTPRVSRIAPSPCLAKARAERCLHARPDAPREALRRAGAAVFPLG